MPTTPPPHHAGTPVTIPDPGTAAEITLVNALVAHGWPHLTRSRASEDVKAVAHQHAQDTVRVVLAGLRRAAGH